MKSLETHHHYGLDHHKKPSHQTMTRVKAWAGEWDREKEKVLTVLVAFLFTIVCLYPTLGMGETSENASVTVETFSRVTGKVVTVGDVAEIKGPKDLVKRIGDIKIGEAPLPGKQKRIPGSMVESKIRSSFPNKDQAPLCSIPGIVVIERAGQEITEPELQALFYSHIEKKLEGRAFRLKDVKIRGHRIVPLGSKVLTIEDKQGKHPKGRISVTVRTEVNNEKSSSIYISGWVDVFGDVVFAQKDIPRGERIRREDIGTSPQNISKAPPGLMTSADKVEGTVARSRIGKGASIRDSMIAEAPVIRKGDVVKIVAKTGELTVVAQGVSKEEGRLDDQILVENIRSHKNIPARVVGPGAVEVLF